MNYKDTFRQILSELKKRSKFTVLHVHLRFKNQEYLMLISSLELGERIEIKKNDDEYLIFITGIEGLPLDGVVHERNSHTILKMIRRMNKEVIKKIIISHNLVNVHSKENQNFKKRYIDIPTNIKRTKTKEDVREQVDRILDRYNDYLYLSENPYFKDEKYKRKAAKILMLMKKSNCYAMESET